MVGMVESFVGDSIVVVVECIRCHGGWIWFFLERGKKCRKVFRLVSGSYNYRQEFASTWTCACGLRTCSITKLDLPDRKGRCARKTLENTNRNEKDLPLITLRSKSIYFIIFSLAHIPENNQVEKLVAIW